MRVLIVDDERNACAALATVLNGRGDVEYFSFASDAAEAEDKLSREAFDVLLLDINLPSLSGATLVDRLQQLHPQPVVVFVTAHREYAVAAFEQHAVDYVLKPFSAERISMALTRAAQKIEADRAARLWTALSPRSLPPRPQPTRIAVKVKGRILFLNPAEVLSVRAEGNYVLLQHSSDSYLLREPLSLVAEKLRPYGFVQIHRSVLVNALFVEEIKPCLTGEYELRLKDGKEYTVTRTYKKNLSHLAESWINSSSFLSD